MPRAWSYEDSQKGGLYTSEKFKEEREARWADIDHLLAMGESPRQIAKRLGVSAESLSRQAYRQGWFERARHFNYGRKKSSR